MSSNFAQLERDKSESMRWLFLLAAFVASGVLHAVTIASMPNSLPTREVLKPIDMEIKIVEPPPPPPPPKPEEPPPEPPKPKFKPPPVKVAELKPPPPEPTPPPPTEEAPKEDTKPAPPIVGISLSNTNAAGSFAAPVGNTAYGKADKAVDPSQVKAYRAPKYLPPGGADSDPELIGSIDIPYPEEAKKADIEGTVNMKITVDDTGKVVDCVVLSGPGYGLNEAARTEIMRRRFKPAMKNGEAFGISFQYKFTFLLD